MSVNGAGGVNPQQLKSLLSAADLNFDKTLKGSEVLVFEKAAEAAGLKYEEKDGKVEGYTIERSTSEKDIKKADDQNMKDAINDSGMKSFKNQRARMNEIREAYMGYLTNALKEAKTPEEKATIIANMNSFPRAAGSVELFDMKVEMWLNQTAMEGLVIATAELTEQRVSNHIDDAVDDVKDNTKKVVTRAANSIKETVLDASDGIKQHTSDVVDQATKNINAHTSATVGGAVTTINQYTGEAVAGAEDRLGKKIADSEKSVKDHVTADGNKTRSAIDKLSNQQAQQAELDAIRDAIEMTFVDELADGDTYRDSVRNWITDQMTGISGDPKISHDEKKQLLNALKDMIDTEMVISDADDLRAGYVGAGAVIGGTIGGGMGLVAGPGSAAVAGAYGAAVGGAIANELADKANLEGDVQKFQKAVQQAQTGALDPNWKWK